MRIKINWPAVVTCTAVAVTMVTAVQHHNTQAQAQAQHEPLASITLAPQVAEYLSDCADYLPVLLDPATGHLFGDQNFDGRLSGQDCESY